MAKAATASPAPARAAAAPAPAKTAPAAAAEASAGQGATPTPAPVQPATRVAAPEPEKKTEELSPAERVKLEKRDFAERMKRAKKAVKEKQAAAKTGGAPVPSFASEPEGDDEAPGGAPEPKPAVASGKSARELLEAGDIEAAFEAAFGKKPQDFKIDSRRWEEWRKAGQRQKSALAEQRKAAEAAVANERKEVSDTIARAQKIYGPMVEGRRAFEAGDVVKAVELCFGVDLNGLQKKALAQYHGKNPEVEELRRELERERKAREERDTTEKTKAEQAALESARAERHDLIRTTLIDGADPQLAKLAVKPGFVRRVFQIQGKHYDPDTDSTVSIEDAAQEARQELIAEFGETFGVASADRSVSAESVQAGSKPANAKNGKAPTSRTLSQRGAAEASEPGRALTQQERYRKYTALAKAEREAG